MTPRNRILSYALLLATSLTQAGPAHAGPSYSLFDLGLLPNPGQYGYSFAYGVNTLGQAAGYASRAGSDDQAILSGGVDGLRSLGSLPGFPASYGFGINDAGQVVGKVLNFSNGTSRAFVHDGAAMVDLGSLPGDRSSAAYAITNFGLAAGSSIGTSEHAVTFSQGRVTDLGTLAGGGVSRATGVNDLGQVVGFSGSASGQRAFVYGPVTGMASLGVLPGGAYSMANGINAGGLVVGASGSSLGQRAFSFDGAMRDLGVLPDATGGSEAFGVNAAGDVVGVSYGTTGPNRAFLYSGGVLYDLSRLITSPGVLMTEARAVSDNGYIVGTAILDGHSHAVALVPNVAAVPEPGSVALLAVGLLGLSGCYGWSRRSAAARAGSPV